MFKLATVASHLGNYAIVLAVAVAAYYAHNSIVRERAIAKLITASEETGRRKNATAKQIRDANKPGAADRLRKHYCRDCWRVRVRKAD